MTQHTDDNLLQVSLSPQLSDWLHRQSAAVDTTPARLLLFILEEFKSVFENGKAGSDDVPARPLPEGSAADENRATGGTRGTPRLEQPRPEKSRHEETVLEKLRRSKSVMEKLRDSSGGGPDKEASSVSSTSGDDPVGNDRAGPKVDGSGGSSPKPRHEDKAQPDPHDENVRSLLEIAEKAAIH